MTEQPSEEVVEKVTYTVTFTYQGKVFATQTVEEGGKVSKPVLMPASGGTWNVDFDAQIYEDMQIEFTE